MTAGMSRVPYVCGNWKMNCTQVEAIALVDDLLPRLDGSGEVEVGVAPPFTALAAVKRRLDGTAVRLVAQNCHPGGKGAFTGEVSIPMLVDVGCDQVLIGHSERRQLFHETNEGVRAKVEAALEGGLGVIVALGETLDERDEGRTRAVVLGQLDAALSGLDAGALGRVVVAYEPVWAIGTGRTATPDQAQEVHGWIRARLRETHGDSAAEGVRIQYGGSMKPDNAAELMARPDIDGGLVGGAALSGESFAAICRAAPGA